LNDFLGGTFIHREQFFFNLAFHPQIQIPT
jgi:hypothetical protein